MLKQIAVWNTDLKLWTKPNEVLFLEHLELYSGTWPTSGMTVNGVAYELPKQVHPTSDTGSLLLQDPVCKVSVPTPTVSDRSFDKPGLMRTVTRTSPNRGVSLPLWASRITEHFYLPTPTTRDYKDGSQPHERDSKVQTDTVARAIFSSGEILLGTPRATASESSSKQVELGAPKSRIEDQVKLFPTLRASDSYERRNQKTMDRIAKHGGDMTMTTLARTTTDWGKFEPAIRRWEAILGRQAPEPTKADGKDGNHRLSSKFTEWMMGLPDGWITGHDLKRNDELKLAGNGVVPQQAELALRLLLELPEREK